MSDIIKPGIMLFLITFVASALLGTVNVMTRDTIAQNERTTKNTAMAEVLPTVRDNNFSEDVLTEPAPESGVTGYNIGYDGETVVGYVVTLKQPAYSGKMDLLVGVTADGAQVTGIKILKHSETPGLGANAEKESFRGQFAGKGGALSVTKSGNPAENEINAIASATITSTAVTNGVNAATAFVTENLAGTKGAQTK
ncbi:MAG: RnfABCDGE type electron transport complex subunit G [Clostridiales bacterium]|jgi:electron transport complex protein RnfG|nr:RnfABCDGE type electron transport complex subunit G [Clostridiales bacterium]